MAVPPRTTECETHSAWSSCLLFPIAALPVPALEAIEALRAAWPEADRAIEQGALRVLDFEDWCVPSSQVRSGVLDPWLEEEKRALLHGAQRPAFMDYERAVSAGFADAGSSRFAATPCNRVDAGWQVLGQRSE